MALDITGKLIKVLPETKGQGRNGEWVKQDFVIETFDQYPKKVCMNVWGEKVGNLAQFKPGDDIKVSFNLESREYNEKWYTDIRAWRIERATANGPAPYAGNQQNYGPPAQQYQNPNPTNDPNYGPNYTPQTQAPVTQTENWDTYTPGPTDDLPF